MPDRLRLRASKATPDFLAKVMEHAQARGADVVLDLSSDKLKELAHKKPLLIKPNHHEMKAIFGVPVDTDDEVRVAMKLAHEAGVQNVLLTRGSRGDASSPTARTSGMPSVSSTSSWSLPSAPATAPSLRSCTSGTRTATTSRRP